MAGASHYSLPLPVFDKPVKALIVVGIYAHIRAMEIMGDRPKPNTWDPRLSPRELEVLKWSSHGKNSQQIADRLTISLPTAETHLANAYRKLNASNKVEAVAIGRPAMTT